MNYFVIRSSYNIIKIIEGFIMKIKLLFILPIVISTVLLQAAGPGPDLWKDLPQEEIDYIKFKSAVNRGDVDTIKQMYNPLYNLDLTDAHGNTILAFAVSKNKPKYNDLAAFLIEKGANVNRGNDRAITPLMWAIIKGNANGVKLLLDNKAKAFDRDQNDKSVLDHALKSNNQEITKLIVDKLTHKDEDEEISDDDDSILALLIHEMREAHY